MADSTPAPAFNIEKPACFYLGREYDLGQKAILSDKYIMYDARDLTTHGVVVGMTGSGKTGLSITLLEEAAIDGIPSVIVDPKGDLTNLLLQFPNLAPADYEPWVNEEDAQQKGVSVKQYAEQIAARWRQGLAETAQTPERIARLKAASEWRIYTPGSEAGLSLSILGTFAAPKTKMPREALTQKIDATATALLGLTGIASDPVQSREHILIAQLLLHSWGDKRDLDLPGLIRQVEKPPIRTIGAYNLETFFPSKERLKFASSLNNVLAAPSFSTWTVGEPLDLSSMLYRAGKPQQLIFYVAHLDDTQRMFFITLLLEELLSWTRKQSGTTNLKALLYFDEVFGYLPPHPANPPSKGPLLTLLKQARAFGVGILLATQNPVDLDYKALSNAGTWFVGKLQTERDKARLLEGLDSVAAEHGTLTDRSYLDKVIASLGSRVFLMHNIHRQAPLLFQSRWSLSFLRGPMTREQVAKLMEPVKEQAGAPPKAIPLCPWCQAEIGPDVQGVCPKCGKPPLSLESVRVQDKAFREGLAGTAPLTAVAVAAPEGLSDSVRHSRPVLPPEVNQFYFPVDLKDPLGASGEVEYQPYVLGFANLIFVVDKRQGKEHTEAVHLLARPAEAGHPIVWDEARAVAGQLAPKPLDNARYAGVPDSLDTGRKLKALEKAFAEFLYTTRKLPLFENRALKLVSEPGESETSFRKRCRDAARREAEQALELEKAKFKPKFEALDAALPDESKKTKETKNSSWWDAINPFAATTIKLPARELTPRQEEKLRKLTADYQSKRAEIVEKWKRIGEECTPIQVKPRKADVHVTHFGIAWVPAVGS
jgi:hypothetical protein